jgi:hypothetical protein
MLCFFSDFNSSQSDELTIFHPGEVECRVENKEKIRKMKHKNKTFDFNACLLFVFVCCECP